MERPLQLSTCTLKSFNKLILLFCCYCVAGPLMIMKLEDRKTVTLLSTIHTAKDVPLDKPNWKGEIVQKPECIVKYNKYMGAVDVCAQMLQYQSFQHRTLKWWKKVFFYLLGLVCLNAYIVYKLHTGAKLQQREFRRQVTSLLVADGGVLERKKLGRPSKQSQENLLRLSARHFPSKVQPKGKKRNPARKCAVCNVPRKDSRNRVESTYECEQCNVGLCVVPCFRIYHSYADYKQAYRRWDRGNEELAVSDSEDTDGD